MLNTNFQSTYLPAPAPDPQTLHKASDELNKSLDEFAKTLSDLNLGVSTAVLIKSEDVEFSSFNHETWLTFKKVGRSWKLVITQGTEDFWEETPLTNTSRETRLLATENLEKLYSSLLKSFEAECGRVNSSLERVRALIGSVQAKKGGGNDS